MTTATSDDTAAAVEAVAGRVFAAGVASCELFSAYLGVALGLYRELAQHPGSNGRELADALGLDHRYVHEWLRAQAVSGYVTRSDDAPATFALAPGVYETLVDPLSPAYAGGLARVAAGIGLAVPHLTAAFKSGEGVAMSRYGPEAVISQAEMNRPRYHHELLDQWIPAVPGLADRLADTTRPAHVADFGCGSGWAAVTLATRRPHLRIDGFDADEASITAARRHAIEAEVADRVRFEVRDLTAGAPSDAAYDAIFFMECLHDMPFPERALAAARARLADGGSVVVIEENADPEPRVPTDDPVQRFLAHGGLLWCVPQGRTSPDARPIGPVIHRDDVTDVATRAGFSGADPLGIEHPFFRFYLCAPESP